MSQTLVPRTLDVDPEIPIVELAVSRSQQEARAAFNAVDALLESGVSKREVLVVASSLQEYEPTLSRAAIRLGYTPTFWTQLDLENTQLFRLLHTTCELLQGGRNLTAENLQTLLAMGWTPPDSMEEVWPLTQQEVVAAFEGIPNANTARFRSIGAYGFDSSSSIS